MVAVVVGAVGAAVDVAVASHFHVAHFVHFVIEPAGQKLGLVAWKRTRALGWGTVGIISHDLQHMSERWWPFHEATMCPMSALHERPDEHASATTKLHMSCLSMHGAAPCVAFDTILPSPSRREPDPAVVFVPAHFALSLSAKHSMSIMNAGLADDSVSTSTATATATPCRCRRS